MEWNCMDMTEMKWKDTPTLPCCRLLHFVFTIAGGRGGLVVSRSRFIFLWPLGWVAASPSFPLHGRLLLDEISQKINSTANL